jgi:hypothetical protein
LRCLGLTSGASRRGALPGTPHDWAVARSGHGGGYGDFAVALVQRIATPGVEINKLFRLVRDDVMEATIDGSKREVPCHSRM